MRWISCSFAAPASCRLPIASASTPGDSLAEAGKCMQYKNLIPRKRIRLRDREGERSPRVGGEKAILLISSREREAREAAGKESVSCPE